MPPVANPDSARQTQHELFASTAKDLGPFPVEIGGEREVLYDYTMRPYSTTRGGKLRSTVLLYRLLAESRQKEKWRQLISAVRRTLGANRTVWGMKLIDGRLSAELYFYFRALSAARAHREPPARIPEPITFSQVVSALAPVLRIKPSYPSQIPAIMVSVDVNDEVLARGEIDELHVYMQSGLSWDVRSDGIEHANHYSFFELQEMDRLRALIEHQANGLFHASACGVDIQKLFLPRLYNCRTICLAAKRRADGIYFAGVDTGQLCWFLEHFTWPESARAFVTAHADDLAHLRWDIGLDFVVTDSGLTWVKSGVYGTF